MSRILPGGHIRLLLVAAVEDAALRGVRPEVVMVPQEALYVGGQGPAHDVTGTLRAVLDDVILRLRRNEQVEVIFQEPGLPGRRSGLVALTRAELATGAGPRPPFPLTQTP